jgi:hypothetical protein
MSPDTETELQRGREAGDALDAQADELQERVETLDDHIDDAKQGLRARREETDDPDYDEEDDDSDDDPLAFDDPEADEDDDEDI